MSHAEFAARIARIESGEATSKSTLYVGLDETYTFARTATMPRSGQGFVQNAIYPCTVAICFCIGVVSNGVQRLIEYRTEGLPDPSADPNWMMLADFTTAVLIAAIIGACLRIGVRDHIAVRVLGVVAGMAGLHNAVHQWPDLFGQIYAPIWVSHVLNNTLAHSVVWRGVSIPF